MIDDVIGTVGGILGPGYVVERMLAGGMSRVALARDVTLGRRVVVKMLPMDWAAGLNVERFRREVVLAAGLQHPHIVPLLTASEAADGTLFYTMPFVDGESLRDRLDAGVPTLEDSVRWLRDIASALAYAHHRGVVHRDMKPDNVLLSDGYAVVADFGIAKALASASTTMAGMGAVVNPITTMGMSIGTPAYMAPEQVAADANADHRADLYALGIIAYELLTGAPPFNGTPQAILVAQLAGKPAPLEQRRAGIPDGIRALVTRLLEKEAADRPQTADEVVSALDGLLHALPPGARSGPARRDAARIGSSIAGTKSLEWLKRHRIAVGVGGAALAVAAVGLSLIDRSPQLQPNRVVVTAPAVRLGDSALHEIARGIAADIAGELSTMDSVDVVSQEQVDLAISDGTAGDGEPEAIAQSFGAAYVVTGRLVAAGSDSVRVHLTLSGADGTIIRALRDLAVARSDVRAGTVSLRQRLAGALLTVRSAEFGRGMLPKGDPPLLAAVTAVRDGLQLEAGLRSADPKEDESVAELLRFDRASSADPEFAQAHLWFASAALRRPGGEVIADSALVLAANRLDELTEYERALLEALRADVRGNNELSVRSWRDAVRHAPSWPNRWWLAVKLRDLNRPRESLAMFDTLGRQDAHFRRWMPGLQHYLSDFDSEYRSLRAERDRAPSASQSLGFQQALLQALSAMKDSTVIVRKLLDAAAQLPAESGSSLAYLLLRTSWELSAHGDAAEGAEVLKRAVSWCRARTAVDLSNVAVAFDCMEAYGYGGIIEPLSALAAPALGARRGDEDVPVFGVLGVAAALRGERALAEQFAARIEQHTRPDGSHGLPSWLRARIAAALGDRERAVSLLEDAFQRGAGWTQRLDLHRDPAFAKLRGFPAFDRLGRSEEQG